MLIGVLGENGAEIGFSAPAGIWTRVTDSKGQYTFPSTWN